MKKLPVRISIILILFLLILFLAVQKKPAQSYPVKSHSGGFVVMELFTSQGCSSCPPADKLLSEYAGINNDHIIPLAFHVDYWNSLGWVDSFSSAKYTARQQDYALNLENASVYTPQLILNGRKEFVGSEAKKISAAVEIELAVTPILTILIEEIESNANSVSIHYNLNELRLNTTLQAALVQKKAFTYILKGENRGLKLTNYNVVRTFISIPLITKSGIVNLPLPLGYNEKDFTIILYAQDDASRRIIGAQKKLL